MVERGQAAAIVSAKRKKKMARALEARYIRHWHTGKLEHGPIFRVAGKSLFKFPICCAFARRPGSEGVREHGESFKVG